MKSKFNRLFSRMLSNKGYTIDQTILIVAIIAILITLVIVTVGWQLINRSSGTKAGAQLKQVEDANGQFFSDQRVWPHQAYTAPAPSPANNMLALANNGITTWAANVDATRLKNFLPGFRVTGGVVQHSFGGNGAITEQANRYVAANNIGTDLRLVVQFAAVPLADAREADRAIDGAEGFNTGRVVYGTTACLNATSGGPISNPGTQPTTGNVFICYAANTIG
jgi:Tfp pilus assembly protein PilE